MKTLRRKIRLNKLRKIRRIRDEILSTNNLGRVTTLLMKIPNVTSYSRGVYDEFYGSGRRINLYLKGGFEYTFAGYDQMIEYAKKASQFAYIEWIKKKV